MQRGADRRSLPAEVTLPTIIANQSVASDVLPLAFCRFRRFARRSRRRANVRESTVARKTAPYVQPFAMKVDRGPR